MTDADRRTVTGSTPYPWPYDGVLDLDRLALVIAGHDAGWAGRAHGAPATAGLLDDLARLLLSRHGLVVRIRHHLGSHRPAAPPGRLAGDPRVVTATAAGVDGFYGSDLDHRLRDAGRDHLLVAGYGLEGPVHSTLRSANDRGYECLLLVDACAPLDPSLTGAARSMVEMSGGIFGAAGTSAALLAALDLPAAPGRLVSPTAPTDLPEEAAS